jgi:hypothetical protein
MNVSLYILGQLADIEPQDLKGEYNLANVGDLSKRLGSKTNQFTLPPTANNQAIFENANQTLSNTGLPYIMIPCQLLCDGVDMRFAKLILNSSGDYGFKVTLFDTSASFFDLIKGKNLKDLNLRNLNHHWNLDSLPLFDDYNNPLTYAVTDCQVDSPNDAFPDNSSSIFLGVLLPMVNENYLIEKIVNERGYTLDNKVLNDGYFEDRKPVIPVSVNQNIIDDDHDRYIGLFSLENQLYAPPLNTAPYQWKLQSILRQNQRYWDAENCPINKLYWMIPDKSTIKFKLRFEVKDSTHISTIGTYNFYWGNWNTYGNIGLEGFSFVRVTDQWTLKEVTATINITGSIDNATNGFYIYGDYPVPSDLEFRNATVEILEANKYGYDSEPNIVWDNPITIYDPRNVYNYLTIANSLPKLTQAEFLKQYSLKYGSIILVNDYKKTVTIRPYKDIFNLWNSEDWSGLVDYTDKPEILYQVDKIIGEYLYGNKMEQDPTTTQPYPKPIGTDLIIDLGNVVKSDKLELKYDATRIIQKPFTSYTAEIAHIPTFESYGYIGSDKTVCLMMREQTGAFEYKDEAVTTINTNTYTTIDNRHFTTYFIESANVFNLGFANDLFNVFYATISKAINDKPIIIKCFMRLGIDKIANFSCENPVYIKELDGYYIVNKIVTSLNTNDSAEVELIKIKL